MDFAKRKNGKTTLLAAIWRYIYTDKLTVKVITDIFSGGNKKIRHELAFNATCKDAGNVMKNKFPGV